MVAQCSPVSTTQKPTSAQQRKRIQDQSNKDEKVRLNPLLTLCTKNIQCCDKPLDEHKWQKTEHWPPQIQCKFRDNFKHKIILTFSNKYLKVLVRLKRPKNTFLFLLDTLCRLGGGYCSCSYQHTPEFFPRKMEFGFAVCERKLELAAGKYINSTGGGGLQETSSRSSCPISSQHKNETQISPSTQC